ncbi:protein phosphatase 2C domain-containing protein [Micromonospora sp. NPDC049679]|uniref:PP2C family protein-serine/threonine phosphatase n=1 Tax=Micromonospora sp. NPDC049679 TaxID=3155920 RepID=UPI0033CC0669
MSVILRTAAVSNPGLVRPNNEDAMHVGQRLLAVADGMGGMPAGELASRIVIKALAPLDAAPPEADAGTALRAALEAANEEIRVSAAADPAQEGMGTTVTALLLSGERFGLLHVGDSRCYLLRDATLSQVTRDDTFVQSLVDQGALTMAEARRHPRRSLITQAVQGEPLSPTSAVLTACPADRLLLCSDGLTDVVADDAIDLVLRTGPGPRDCAERLVELALAAGAPDNVTVVVADVLSG